MKKCLFRSFILRPSLYLHMPFLGHMNHCCYLILSVVILTSFVGCKLLNIFSLFSGTTELIDLNLAYSIFRYWGVKLVKFVFHGYLGQVELKPSKLMQSLKNILFLYSWISNCPTVGIYVIIIKLSSKIVNFMAPGSRLGSNDLIVRIL